MGHDRRSYAGIVDQTLMRALVEAAPEKHLHVIDLPYRFSSWALDEPEQASLWRTPSGGLHAWAWLQTPFWALDFAQHPGAGAADREVKTSLRGILPSVAPASCRVTPAAAHAAGIPCG